MKRIFNHEDVFTSTTVNDRVINRCFVQEETKKEVIHHKVSQVESDSVSFSVTYQKNLEIRHENPHGQKFKFPLERSDPVRKLEHHIPNQFLVSKETCLDHVMVVLSEMHLPPSIQESLVQYISSESVKFSRCGGSRGGGFKVEVNVEVNRARRVKRKVTATDCSLCSTEFSSAVSCMELHCSHIFHRDCVMEWLEKSPSCPTCRAKTLGETVSILVL